jgi:predicted MFS family arabinose efflux permease
MSAFSLAAVLGVPIGLDLGNRFGWHTPFLVLVALGLPILGLGIWALPPLKGHLGKGRGNAWARVVETYTHPNHLRAFALVVSVMLGTFMVVPFIGPYLVKNSGLTQGELRWIYVGGGVVSLVSSPLVGRWADKSGKLKVYRIIAPLSALMILCLTNLPKVWVGVAVGAVSLLMASNAGRMVAALAMINASVEPRLRGGFMSAYSSVQHIASGIGAFIAGLIIGTAADGQKTHYWVVGLMGAASTMLSLWFAGRLRPVSKPVLPISEPMADLIDTVPATAEAF